ncbi:DUF1294 domain-containing protein [Priestia aryabhattai]|uniref:DUF1294 domain-containing protein n=1 Tax=Priestia aryabhattai TaxID=412384 RepID=UPI001C0D4CA5|nr:DUF1294 domain-containing protein [Priestia aryabhattai]MBU3572210.1 DUF1294 domain-containing protein [Priestia aryabhattai]
MNELLLTYFIVINIVGIGMMYRDKQKAKRHEWRIAESTLWTVAAVGGAIGGLIGMYCYRHKTKHPSFTVGFPILAALDLLFFFVIS